jgi:translocator protein
LIRPLIIFLILNFGALAIGGLFTSAGVNSMWYEGIQKAPWTPPGWVFGTAWTIIMICFSLYMAEAWNSINSKTSLVVLFSLQWILNVMWNPVFFKFHLVGLGLIVISALTILIAYLLIKYRTDLKLTTLLIAPYFLWLLIATSLNAFIFLKN